MHEQGVGEQVVGQNCCGEHAIGLEVLLKPFLVVRPLLCLPRADRSGTGRASGGQLAHRRLAHRGRQAHRSGFRVHRVRQQVQRIFRLAGRGRGEDEVEHIHQLARHVADSLLD